MLEDCELAAGWSLLLTCQIFGGENQFTRVLGMPTPSPPLDDLRLARAFPLFVRTSLDFARPLIQGLAFDLQKFPLGLTGETMSPTATPSHRLSLVISVSVGERTCGQQDRKRLCHVMQ
ncbi:hypothetical protein C0Q70_13537 [Pomacea canaliculata]|uniref:Uncharacterized protein n=1 Tax=Pomacea canaliculata TaxID=400727 RepID=A0A2T7NXK6_POMCA|nr:hypothetical protein C0Q70_13537 [Pomacea canaliculata]